MSGLLHIYCGEGKGKTTAAVGLAVRAAGAGFKVCFAQFMKSGNSSELNILRSLENLQVKNCDTVKGFFRNMTAEQRRQASADYTAMLKQVLAQAEAFQLLVLDEIISSCNNGIVEEGLLLEFLDNRPLQTEVVLTGRNPSAALLARADYVTEMTKRKHPLDDGVRARRGIEF